MASRNKLSIFCWFKGEDLYFLEIIFLNTKLSGNKTAVKTCLGGVVFVQIKIKTISVWKITLHQTSHILA